MNLELSPGEAQLQQDVRQFIAEHLTDAMRRGQAHTSSLYPAPEVFLPWQRALAKRGWLVPLWPIEWGGTGWTPVERFIFETECAQAGAPLVHPMGVRLVGPVLLRFGTDAQKAYFLPRIVASDDYWCQGFSEPEAGSDLASLRLRATPDGDDYVLTGSKLWTSYAHLANRMFALVRTGPPDSRHRGISFLLIDMDSPGITVRPIRTLGGEHEVNEVFFDSVRVPQSRRIGEENAGWACARYLLEFERGAGIFSPRLRSQLARVGNALEVLQARGRQVLDPGFVQRFGEVLADLDIFEMLELRTLGLVQPGQSPGTVSSMLKLQASRLRQSISELGVDALGLEALRWHGDPASESDQLLSTLLPDYLNSRAFTIFGGAAEVQLGIIAKSLGESRPTSATS